MQFMLDFYMIFFIALISFQLLLFRLQCFKAVDWITYIAIIATSMLFFIVALDALTSI